MPKPASPQYRTPVPDQRGGPRLPLPMTAPAEATPAQAPSLAERMRQLPGLAVLVRDAEAVWRARAEAAGEAGSTAPGWRAFEDSFPTFYEFTNRPRRAR